jgi:argininosuccinate synthase
LGRADKTYAYTEWYLTAYRGVLRQVLRDNMVAFLKPVYNTIKTAMVVMTVMKGNLYDVVHQPCRSQYTQCVSHYSARASQAP